MLVSKSYIIVGIKLLLCREDLSGWEYREDEQERRRRFRVQQEFEKRVAVGWHIFAIVPDVDVWDILCRLRLNVAAASRTSLNRFLRNTLVGSCSHRYIFVRLKTHCSILWTLFVVEMQGKNGRKRSLREIERELSGTPAPSELYMTGHSRCFY